MRNISILLSIALLSFNALGSPFARIQNESGTKRLQLASKTYRHETGHKVTLMAVAHRAESSFYAEVQNTIDVAEYTIAEDISTKGFFNNVIDDERCIKWLKLQTSKPSIEDLSLVDQGDSLKYPPNHSFIDTNWATLVAEFLKIDAVKKLIEGNDPEQRNACSKFLAIEAFKVGKSISEILNATLDATPRKSIRSRADLASLIIESVNREKIDPEDPVVIDFRNDLVIKALKVALDSGQAPNFTVVYGGAHMHGIEKGILDMGYTPESETWLTAFSFVERDEL